MKMTTAIQSLMQFNKRVLESGEVTDNDIYTLENLKNKLFFNKVFTNNMDEVFRKYSYIDIIDEYINLLKVYIKNIQLIKNRIENADLNIKIEDKFTFERKLMIESRIEGNIISNIYSNLKSIKYDFDNDIIYYLTQANGNCIVISYIDKSHSIYEKPLSYKFQNYIKYWKTDESIIYSLNKKYNTDSTVAIHVTSKNNNYSVIKVEYNGKEEMMRKYLNLFPYDVLIVSNPYIYIDDINYIIDTRVGTVIEEKITINKIQLEPLKKDILIEYPQYNFNDYLQLLSLASKSDLIDSIYMTLYRIGLDPSIYNILKEAVSNGIKVQVNIELHASGEKINVFWANEMRKVGIDVTTYALGVLKVHAKLTLIKFKDGNMISQIGTGNYHTVTTTQYTDLSLVTSNLKICKYVSLLFDLFIGKRKKFFGNSFLITKLNAKYELLNLINRESDLGINGYIAIKCNALDDDDINNALNNAAINKCNINLIIRGICTWIPDQIGYNVKIQSIIWDKLEHSRVYCFGKINPQIYIGSLDLTTDKIENRIEVLVKIIDPDIIEKLCEYMNQYIINTENSWELLRSGEYRKVLA
jgi:polyphosphate kinase